MSKTYTITAALPYTNGPIHIGHLAGVYIPADIYARFLRMTGNDVIYICGSDEHGVPITIKAKNENKSPQEIVDRYHQNIKQSFSEFGISFDNYSRTSSKIHHQTASDVYGQCKSWLDDGLKPRAVTRDLDWGVPVPVKGADGKVLYVWFDAPIGYISSTKEWAHENKKDWKKYWKDNKTQLIHFIGKDNIVFHCIIFPSMLKAHGDFIVPKNVPANEFLNLEGSKISTSKNWAVWLPEYLKDFPDKQDVLRYVLTINAPENKDNDFTWKDFQNRNNGELVSILGNFINRVVVLTKKYYQSIIPTKNKLFDADKLALKLVNQSIINIESHG